MNAIEIKGLKKSFRGLYAVNGLDMHVPVGSIYGFIGENGSGKSTTEKLICGHLVPDGGEIKLFGRPCSDAGVRARVGALIENAGCFPSSSVRANLTMQALNLGIENRDREVDRVLETVRMRGEDKTKFSRCSLGMKQRIGIAMALLGDPALLVLDEPINGLDADGMRIMREILTDITESLGCTVLISSHVLGELEKIATHYGVIRQGRMISELSAAEMDSRSRCYVSLRAEGAADFLKGRFATVKEEEGGIRVYDTDDAEGIARLLYGAGFCVSEIYCNRIGLEEYYIGLMSAREGSYDVGARA